jgi:hypothetical protein
MEAALLDLSRKVTRKAVPDTDIDALLNCTDTSQVLNNAKRILSENPGQADNLLVAFLGDLWLNHFIHNARLSAAICKAVTEWNSVKRLKHTSNSIYTILLLCVESKTIGKSRVGLLSGSSIQTRTERYRAEIESLERHKFMVKYLRLATTNILFMELNAVYCWLKHPKRVGYLVQSICGTVQEIEITSIDEYDLFTDCVTKTDGLWFAWYLLILVCKERKLKHPQSKWKDLDDMVSNYLLVTKILWKEEKDKHFFVILVAELWNTASRFEMGKNIKDDVVDNVIAKLELFEGNVKPTFTPKQSRRQKQSKVDSTKISEEPKHFPKTNDLDYLMFFTHKTQNEC